jgi:hypothetical protein
VTLCLVAPPLPLLRLEAQGPVIIEWGAHATFTAGDSLRPGLIAGPRLGLRTPGGTRGVVSFGAGFQGDSASARAEAALEYQLTPRAAGMGLYFGGGLAGVVGGGRGGFLLLYLGIEQAPGRRRGWALEAGLGGGFRVRAAYHWRRFPGRPPAGG